MRPADAKLHALARELADLQKRAKALGLFANDRELLSILCEPGGGRHRTGKNAQTTGGAKMKSGKAHQLCGGPLPKRLDELNEVLAA